LPRERHTLREAYSGNIHLGVAQRRDNAHRRDLDNTQAIDTGVGVSSAGGTQGL